TERSSDAGVNEPGHLLREKEFAAEQDPGWPAPTERSQRWRRQAHLNICAAGLAGEPSLRPLVPGRLRAHLVGLEVFSDARDGCVHIRLRDEGGDHVPVGLREAVGCDAAVLVEN